MNEIINWMEGTLVRLIPVDSERDSKKFAEWHRNSEYSRLLNGDPALMFSSKGIGEWLKKNELAKDMVFFAIQSIEDGTIIGEIGLDDIQPGSPNVFVGISIGDPQYWGRGYGTDAMRILLRYAFSFLNMHRVSLSVFGYNERAIRSYEKAGFRHEGSLHNWLNRDGRRWDLHFMGILQSEWKTEKAN